MEQQSGGNKTIIVQLHKRTLKRVLGIFDLFAIGYGDLGSSIYYALGITALFALGATPISLGLAGLVFVCTALTYAEMTSAFHESGGSASFARHAFNDLVSFIAGWGLLLDYIVTIAISAFAVGPYLAFFYAPLHNADVQIWFSIGLVFILFLMNVFGAKQSTRISLLLTAFTILIQAIVITIGFGTILDLSTIVDHMRIGIPNAVWSPSWSDFIRGTAMAMVAYTGIESISMLAAEAQKPARTVPRAIILTMFILIAVYLGLSVTALSAITPHDLGTKYVLNPVAGIVEALPFGKHFLLPCISVLAAVVLIVAANAGLIGSSRLSFNMGKYYQLPRIFYRLEARFRTPVISLVFFTVVASFIILTSRGNLDLLADLYNFGAMLAFTSAHLALLVLRVKKPDMKRPFKIPLNIKIRGYELPVTALIGSMATISVWCLIMITKREGRYLGLAWMAFGMAMYFYYRRAKKIKPMGRVAIEQIKIPGYRPMNVRNILVPTRGGLQTETVQMACELAKVHGAKVTAIQVIEIASSLPLDIEIPDRVAAAEAILKRAEVIAQDLNVNMELKLVRSRSIPDTILELLRKGKYDLLVLGALKPARLARNKGLGAIAERVLKEAPCRVWVCASEAERFLKE